MKILVLSNSNGGLLCFRKELLERLSKNNEVIVSTPDGSRVNELLETNCSFLKIIFKRRGTNPFTDYRLFKEYCRIIRKIVPDIILTYTIKPNIYGGLASQKCKTPYIANITGLGSALEKKGPLQKLVVFLYKKALKTASIVFLQNKQNMDFMLKNNILKTDYDLLPGSGVNLSRFKYEEYPKGKTTVFLFAARIMEEKGINEFLEAALFYKNKKELVFHICGECDKKYSQIIDKYDKEKVVYYHGPVSNMATFYKMASCIVLPTFYPEGMSNVLLESCASGRPIIATNRSGTKEIIDDGINGFVIKERDSEDLINKIAKFASLTYEQKKQLGMNARRKVELLFDRKIVVDKYLNAIKKYSKKS